MSSAPSDSSSRSACQLTLNGILILSDVIYLKNKRIYHYDP